MEVFGQKLWFFGKSDCIRAEVDLFGKMAVFGKKWLFSGKMWLYSDKVVVFGKI